MHRTSIRTTAGLLVGAALAIAPGCAPRVVVEPPREPIVINLNVKIEHEVRVKVERDLEEEFRKNEEIF